MLKRSIALTLVAIDFLALIYYPYGQIVLAIGLCIYGAILYRYPNSWLIVIPALLPVLDLAPWSGWFFFDELDLFILLTLAVGLSRSTNPSIPLRHLQALFRLAFLCLSVSYGVSLIIGLLPLQPLDANAFSNYYSHYNSLRMAKGFFEAAALFLLFLGQSHDDTEISRYLTAGMVLGLTGVVIAVIWERFVFSGLFDFTSDFRITATFSALHNGGNDPEAYLVLAQPFVFAWAMNRRKFHAWNIAIALFAASTYAMLVTYSRAGYLGLAVSWMVLVFCYLWQKATSASLRASILVVSFLATALVIAIPVFKGGYISSRFTTSREDADYRLTQSANSVRIMNGDWVTRMFGMGLGKYPEIFYLRKPLPITPATYNFVRDGDQTFLRLFPGSPLYFEQYVAAKPANLYSLAIKVRGGRRAALNIFVCEKNLLYSFGCAATVVLDVESSGGWKQQTATINMFASGSDAGLLGWFSNRPVKFTLSSPGPEPVDVDDIRLVDASGRNIIDNGDFSSGIDRWFFATDEHLAWQIKNHWVHIYFEQGWFGLSAHLFFATFVAASLLFRVAKGVEFSAVPLASIVGFFTVGMFGFLFDAPRMATLFFFLAMSSLVCSQNPPQKPARTELSMAGA